MPRGTIGKYLGCSVNARRFFFGLLVRLFYQQTNYFGFHRPASVGNVCACIIGLSESVQKEKHFAHLATHPRDYRYMQTYSFRHCLLFLWVHSNVMCNFRIYCFSDVMAMKREKLLVSWSFGMLLAWRWGGEGLHYTLLIQLKLHH